MTVGTIASATELAPKANMATLQRELLASAAAIAANEADDIPEPLLREAAAATSSLPKLQPPAAMLRIPRAADWSGLSRSRLYREWKDGRLIFRKIGRATLVDGASLCALVQSLPAAK
jgi:hypothetical protein